tara:strand:+ start:2279 stop:2578 length:300 start_codon:yes stop_codon:yes gene_type:complete
MLTKKIFQIISSIYNNTLIYITKYLNILNNNTPDYIKYKVINIYSFLNNKISNYTENIFKIKDVIIRKKNNIIINISNKKNDIYNYIINKKLIFANKYI